MWQFGGGAGELNAALNAYLRARELFPGNPKLAWQLADLYEAKGDFEKAAPEWANALALDKQQYSATAGRLSQEERAEAQQRLKNLTKP